MSEKCGCNVMTGRRKGILYCSEHEPLYANAERLLRAARKVWSEASGTAPEGQKSRTAPSFAALDELGAAIAACSPKPGEGES